MLPRTRKAALLFLLLPAFARAGCELVASPLHIDAGNEEVAYATGELTVRCDPGAPYAVRVDPALASEGPIVLTLCLDAACREPWGDGAGGTGVYRGVGTGSEQTIPVHARLERFCLPAEREYRATRIFTIDWEDAP